MTQPNRRPFCTCPACDTLTVADGIFYCCVDREWVAYSNGQFIYACKSSSLVAERLAAYRIDQAAQDARAVAAAPANIPATIAPVTQDAPNNESGEIIQARQELAAREADERFYRDLAGSLVGKKNEAARRANYQKANEELSKVVAARRALAALIEAEQESAVENVAVPEDLPCDDELDAELAPICTLCGCEYPQRPNEIGDNTCDYCTDLLRKEFEQEERRAGVDEIYPYQKESPMITTHAQNKIADIAAQIASAQKDMAAKTENVRTSAQHRDRAYTAQQEAKAEYDNLESALAAQIAVEINPETNKPMFSNDTARKAQLVARLDNYPTVIGNYRQTESDHRAAKSEFEMAEMELKTARALLSFQTAQAHLMAEIIAADRAAQDSIPF